MALALQVVSSLTAAVLTGVRQGTGVPVIAGVIPVGVDAAQGVITVVVGAGVSVIAIYRIALADPLYADRVGHAQARVLTGNPIEKLLLAAIGSRTCGHSAGIVVGACLLVHRAVAVVVHAIAHL